MSKTISEKWDVYSALVSEGSSGTKTRYSKDLDFLEAKNLSKKMNLSSNLYWYFIRKAQD